MTEFDSRIDLLAAVRSSNSRSEDARGTGKGVPTLTSTSNSNGSPATVSSPAGGMVARHFSRQTSPGCTSSSHRLPRRRAQPPRRRAGASAPGFGSAEGGVRDAAAPVSAMQKGGRIWSAPGADGFTVHKHLQLPRARSCPCRGKAARDLTGRGGGGWGGLLLRKVWARSAAGWARALDVLERGVRDERLDGVGAVLGDVGSQLDGRADLPPPRAHARARVGTGAGCAGGRKCR